MLAGDSSKITISGESAGLWSVGFCCIIRKVGRILEMELCSLVDQPE